MWLLAGVAFSCALAVFLATGGGLRRDGTSIRSSCAWLAGCAQRCAVIRRARKQRSRRALAAACEHQMPELLDILGLGLSAGLSFDGALELYCDRRNTELAREMRAALRSWQMGLSSRVQALEDVAAQVESPSMSSFTAAVREALAFGSPLATTLERQAAVLREEQRALTRKRVEEAPVRMLVPLGTLVVPAMLLAILGPLLSVALSI